MGDCIELRLDGAVDWLFNGEVMYTHKMGAGMSEKDLYPYLMLACAGDSVLINCDEGNP
jgi:hypothetical protein